MIGIPSRPRAARVAAVAAAALCAASAVRGAGHSAVVADDRKEGVRISFRSAFDNPPPCGFAPVRLEIRNESEAERTWQFSFESASDYSRNRSVRSGTALTVPARAERSVEFAAPMTYSDYAGSGPWLSLEVRGPGARDSAHQWMSSGSYASDLTPFVAVAESLYPSKWSLLEALIQTNTSKSLRGTQFAPALAPSDARGWIGCDSVWLTDADWTGLDAAQREALLDWVRLGGRLHLCADRRLPPLAGLQPGGHAVGLGQVGAWAFPGHRELLEHMAKTIPNEPSLREDLADSRKPGWNGAARTAVPSVVVRPAVMTLAVFVIAIVIGPLNLILLARRQRHLHLFWTTPALALAASVVLMALIVLQDGFGGRGIRFAAVYLDAAAHKAFVVQEQLSRCGVLLNRRIPMHDPVFMADVRSDARTRNERRQYAYGDGALEGDWFSSRSVQDHVLAVVRPSRARLEVLEGPAGAPTAVSGLGVTLQRVYYRGADGRVWTVKDLPTGERRALQSATDSDLRGWWAGRAGEGGRRMRALDLAAACGERGFFYAEAASAGDDAIETLPSVRWTSRGALYFGPAAPAGGGAAP
jgi:hypothetical protein